MEIDVSAEPAPILDAIDPSPLLPRRHNFFHGSRKRLCLMCSGILLTLVLLIVPSAVQSLYSIRGPDRQQYAVWKPSSVPGWLFERTFHESGGTFCPWVVGAPTEDWACQQRAQRIQSLLSKLSTCEAPLAKTIRSIAHRGGPLVAPEETFASWRVGIESGAATIECDAAITKSLQFVCRHSVCDLHFTTDILRRPEMHSRCSKPFMPAQGGHNASAQCCTYDFTAEELDSLCATMESGVNPHATSIDAYLLGAPAFRSPYIANQTCHKLAFFDEYLRLAKMNAVSVIPELKDTTKPGLIAFLDSVGKVCTNLLHRRLTPLHL